MKVRVSIINIIRPRFAGNHFLQRDYGRDQGAKTFAFAVHMAVHGDICEVRRADVHVVERLADVNFIAKHSELLRY